MLRLTEIDSSYSTKKTNAIIQLTGRVNDLENRMREYNAKVEGPGDGHFIVKRAHVEIQSAQNETRIAREELATERSVFLKKIEQLTAEHDRY